MLSGMDFDAFDDFASDVHNLHFGVGVAVQLIGEDDAVVRRVGEGGHQLGRGFGGCCDSDEAVAVIWRFDADSGTL